MNGNPRPRSVRVIGIGNPDRGDDAIGAIVAKRLEGRLPGDVSVIARGGDMMMLSDDMAEFDALVCIDASAPAGTPGRMRRIDTAREGAAGLGAEMAFASSHALGLADAIALAEALGIAPRDIVVYAIEGACFEPGAAVTPAVAAAADEVAAQVAAEVARLRGMSNEEPDHA